MNFEYETMEARCVFLLIIAISFVVKNNDFSTKICTDIGKTKSFVLSACDMVHFDISEMIDHVFLVVIQGYQQ